MGEKKKERGRIRCRIDELPEDIQKLINMRLSDVSYTYLAIAQEVTEMGYEISKSSVGRYALRKNKVSNRLKEAMQTTKVLVEAMKDNNDLGATEAATMILANELAQKVATAQEEIDEMDITDASKLLIQLQRTSVYKEKFKLEYKKGVNDAAEMIKKLMKEEIKNRPDLIEQINEIIDKAAASMEESNE